MKTTRNGHIKEGAVVRVLTRKYGVSRERLTPVGASFSSPVSSNETEKGRALNRRVEFVENRTGLEK